jgi:hypothetical protein
VGLRKNCYKCQCRIINHYIPEQSFNGSRKTIFIIECDECEECDLEIECDIYSLFPPSSTTQKNKKKKGRSILWT